MFEDGGFLIAAFGGVISFLSPCVLPLVPAYLCYMAGTTLEELTREGQDEDTAKRMNRRVLIGTLGFVLGFSTVFVMLGASASAVSPFLLANKIWLGQVAGVIIVLLGVHYMGVFRFAFLDREARFMPNMLGRGDGEPSLLLKLAGPYIIGLAFAFGWTPCIGPILGTILTIAASQDSLGYGVALLATYSLGLGIPFLAAALAVRAFLSFSSGFRKHLHKVELAAGLLLVLTGVLMFLGSFEEIAGFLVREVPWLQEFG